MSLSPASSETSLNTLGVNQQSFITPQSYDRGSKKVRALSVLLVAVGTLVAAAGISAAVVTGIGALWAIPVAALVLSVVLILVIQRSRTKFSLIPFGESSKGPVLGFANTEPDFAQGLGAELLRQE
ncbi:MULTISPECIES: hypothetical protein [Chlamydia]|uniref:Uncharacterized protein n=1 Tax=Chlamydophila parapsittaci TaxID=344886 RepID=A0ABX5W0E6_9CHLA|nr:MULTISPECIES: hypothetical protein [Chlamydia]AFS19428.1 hypothetical protein B595_0459 [Chlamydia psittaci 84/55]AFS22622.1 hypothetical protein B600_0462 [Chlamydia psittaci VS225]EPJ15483.1 hypothetical protein CP02DC18_0853 [Chlamydia psittaci 02DC18]EPJ16833.1 hypothetical protein CP02DC22_0847 [Chlamydia psittaci 02DC22]EPJ20088.1 hypothetical protein CP02DC21_0832 [Chlamydia psittaci 02DC21]EPJ21181.1 hypothetical protein CP02DC23_0123 [Chlamydia psittaci 02DC23]EPJ23355.1 hypothet